MDDQNAPPGSPPENPPKVKRKVGRPRKEAAGEKAGELRKESHPWNRPRAAAVRLLPSEKIALREVDMDVTFRRANQMVEWMLDRMEDEIDGSTTFEGVPMKFGSFVRDLASAMNTLSAAHSRWLKANEEMYERLTDDEKLEALKKWLPALYARHPDRVSAFLRDVAVACRDVGKSKYEEGTNGPGNAGSPLEAVIGPIPTSPKWKEVAAQVRREFEEKRLRKFGPRQGEWHDAQEEAAARRVWDERQRNGEGIHMDATADENGLRADQAERGVVVVDEGGGDGDPDRN